MVSKNAQRIRWRKTTLREFYTNLSLKTWRLWTSNYTQMFSIREKKMVVVFFDKKGIIKTIHLDEQKTVTAKWYSEICLHQLIESLKNLRSNTSRLQHDNPRIALSLKISLNSAVLILLEHPPYSADLKD